MILRSKPFPAKFFMKLVSINIRLHNTMNMVSRTLHRVFFAISLITVPVLAWEQKARRGIVMSMNTLNV